MAVMARNVFIIVITCFSLAGYSQDTTRLSLLFLGDIMQHDSQIADAYDPITKSYNYKPCFQYVKPYTLGVDLAIGNLEVTLAGTPYKGYPQFSAPDDLLVALEDMGLDVLVTANNHCVDRGKKGLERTIQMLDSLGIQHTGTFEDELERLNEYPLLIEKNGFRLALLNYTYGTNGLPVTEPNIVNMIDKTQISKDMAKAKEMRPDAIIVFTHWGSEYQSLPSAWQKEIGKFCFDLGADIVIGAHPHVIQPMEWNRQDNRMIVYSLGNFVSGQRKRYTDGGAMIRFELEKVKVNDSLSFTGIDTASYILQWVYRTADAQKNYFVLPVPVAENNPSKYIRDADSRAAFKIFTDDSRALLNKYNINIREMISPSEYIIEYTGSYADTVKIREVTGPGVPVKIVVEGPAPMIHVGPLSEPDAKHYLRNIGLEKGRIRRRGY
jgi:poly-gamma-glutamate capsule biosynthesis protein CapA/YwtB (metallophosphatase superfamily)